MKRLLLGLGALALLASLFATMSESVTAAHLGNSKASLSGTGDADAEGMSVVNFRSGTESFNASVSVTNLVPGAAYTFLVRSSAGVVRTICTDTANTQGFFICGAQDVLPDGFGLTQAVVRDASGTEVAVGVYERRGNCRAPEQVGSQCEAPGHQH